ncbi:hypothetical protein D3C80_884540 [compost metagenome]
MTGRIAKCWDEHQCPYISRLTRSFKSIGQYAFSIRRQRTQREAKYIGKTDDAMIGQAFRKHYFTRLNDSSNRKKKSMRGAIRNNDAPRININRQATQPVPCGSTMSVQPSNWTTRTHEACIVRLAHFLQQTTRGILVGFRIDSANDRQIRGSAGIPIKHEAVRPLRHAIADISSPADFATQIAAPLGFFVADTDRLNGQPQFVREITMRWHTSLRFQDTLLNILNDLFSQKPMFGGSLSHLQRRLPHIEGHKIITSHRLS